ncbi:MAG: hypothetical protein R6U01_13625 [Halorubrum sp.]|uniref:hypothetical protein n=1 Tax=Halorubrum sp. TaxID=1879286 RepID=UPI003970B4CB
MNRDLARAFEHSGVRSAETSVALTTTSGWSSSSRGTSVGWPPRATVAASRAGPTATDPRKTPSRRTSNARLDFHDRRLSVLASGLRSALDEEPGTSVDGRLARFLDAFVAADVDDLAVRLDAGAGGERDHAVAENPDGGERR